MSEIRVDTISEKTSANGVAIDGVTIKDGGIAATGDISLDGGNFVFNESNFKNNLGDKLFPKPSFSYSNLANDVLMNPYQAPERNIQPNPNIDYNRGLPINIQTQPPVDSSYRQVGILSRQGGEEMVIPLMGRPLITNRDKWNFYAMSDKNNMVKIGVYSNGKNCMGDYGCNDLMNGDIITVDGFQGNFKVTIYENDKPKYIPYI